MKVYHKIEKRRCAAIEAKKSGRSSITYIAKLLGCSRSTVYAGLYCERP
ncbi:MAG: helix-turn-helix domain-containing protein [Methylococcales bacterium]